MTILRLRLLFCYGDSQGYVASLRELQSIRQEVHEHLLDASGIAVDAERAARVDIGVESDLLELALLGEEAGNFLDQSTYIEEVVLQGEVPVSELGQILNVLDHLEDELHTQVEVLQLQFEDVTAIGLKHRVFGYHLKYIASAIDAVQRRLKVMQDLGELEHLLLPRLVDTGDFAHLADVPIDSEDKELGAAKFQLLHLELQDFAIGCHFEALGLFTISFDQIFKQVRKSE